MKSRFNVVSLLSVFLLLFALGGMASADVATDVSVAISYPCDQGEMCDETGVAVSRSGSEFTGPGLGDRVNIYITLVDGNGDPATAGPNGEELDVLEAIVTASLGTVIIDDEFEQQTSAETTVSFMEDRGAVARCFVGYTDAQVGNGTDTINVAIPGNPLSIAGSAQVNVVAPPAVDLVVRTCPDVPDTLYEDIEDPCNNEDDTEEAGTAVTVTVIADEGDELYTTAPNLEGQQVTVCAYADYDADGDAGDEEQEKEPVACDDFTMNDGIAQGSLTINRAGPAGLEVVFTATAEDKDGETVESDQIDDDSDIELPDWDVDTVVMVPGDPDTIKVAEDVFGNGNYIMEPEGDCLRVLDDAGDLCEGDGTEVDILVVIADALGNAVNPLGDVAVVGSLPGILDEQLEGCRLFDIAGYADTCTLNDGNPTDAGIGIPRGRLEFTTVDLGGDDVTIYLMPPDSCGVTDLFVTVEEADLLATGPINAGDTLEVTIESNGDTQVVEEGDDLVLTGNDGMSLLSSDGCATLTTTLALNNVADTDSLKDGLQVEIQVCGEATNAPDETVTLTVEDLDQCGVKAMSDDIEDVQPGEPTNLAVVGLDPDVESDSILDETGNYVGTPDIEIDSFIIADGSTLTRILNAGDGGCDLQVWDPYTNVFDPAPELACTTNSGNALPVDVDGCDVSVGFTTGAAGTDVLVTCAVDTDDYLAVINRTFLLTNIVLEEPEEGEDPGNPATALVGMKEGPQDVDGNQINPPAGGESIIRIGVNGDLDVSFVNVTINITEGSVPGAELRDLNGNPISLPLPESLEDDEDQRYILYAPTAGQVTVVVTEDSNEGLAPGSVTVVFGEACSVSISPANPTVATETTQQFTAVTACGEADPSEPAYTWEIVAAGTTADCTGSTIDANGLYTAPATDTECADVVKVTDTANGNATAETTVTVIPCAEAPVVTVTPASPECVAQEFCAATTLCGADVMGEYTWSVTGGTADSTTGDCITVTPEGTASFTVTATDTANANAQGSATGDCIGIEATFTGCGRPGWFSFGVVEIQGTGTNLGLLSIVRYDSPLVIGGLKLTNAQTQTINQFVLLLPSILFPGIIGEPQDYPTTVGVTVNQLSDTILIPSCTEQ